MREEHFQVGLHLLEMPSFTFFDPFKGSGTFGSLLHLAVAKLQVEHVKIMLQHDISPCLVDELSGDTPLHVLVTVYHKRPAEARELLQLLVDFGANINARNKENWTPLHFAVRRGNLAATKALLEIGGNKPRKSWLVSKTPREHYVEIDAMGGVDKLTPLHLAASNSYYDIVDALFQYKANLFAQNRDGATVFTAIQNNLLMIKLLKKEEKAYFYDNYKSQRNVKEMHITNSIFVKQALEESGRRAGDAEIPNQTRDYQSLRHTLASVNSLLQKPLRASNRQSVFQHDLDTFKKTQHSD